MVHEMPGLTWGLRSHVESGVEGCAGSRLPLHRLLAAGCPLLFPRSSVVPTWATFQDSAHTLGLVPVSRQRLVVLSL